MAMSNPAAPPPRITNLVLGVCDMVQILVKVKKKKLNFLRAFGAGSNYLHVMTPNAIIIMYYMSVSLYAISFESCDDFFFGKKLLFLGRYYHLRYPYRWIRVFIR